jgi:hypothetical protein
MDLSITITPIEGRVGAKAEAFNCFYDANIALHTHSKIHNAPERGNGYLKTNVLVALDGLEYDFRYDMVAGGAEAGDLGMYPDLRKTLVSRLRFYAGENCPKHMTAEAYQDFLDTYAKGAYDWFCKELLEKLEAVQ